MEMGKRANVHGNSGRETLNTHARMQNYCNEPIKLNGSLALTAEPIASYPSELLTSITSTLAPTSPLNIQPASSGGAPAQQTARQSGASARQYQVLLVGTGDGRLKRLVLVSDSASQRIKALEFDSLQVVASEAGASGSGGANGGEQQQPTAILQDLNLIPRHNPQLNWPAGTNSANSNSDSRWHQHALVASAHKLVKVRVNSCKAQRQRLGQQVAAGSGNSQNASTIDECLACAQVQDPFCGWCSSASACTTRDECLSSGLSAHNNHAIHWTPFDSIRCSNYQPVSPKNVALQADALAGQQQPLVDVNVRLGQANGPLAPGQLAARLAQAQFSCHFDYLAHWNQSAGGSGDGPQPSGATTKATQARLNLQANTVAIGCPLPTPNQRPSLAPGQTDHMRVRLGVRLQANERLEPAAAELVERALGMRLQGQSEEGAGGRTGGVQEAGSRTQGAEGGRAGDEQARSEPIERELTLYDCSLNTNCHACLSAGSAGRRWACAWCPLSGRCTHNSSHPDYGCAASAVASTTPLSQHAPHSIRGSHLTPSLDLAQARAFSLAIGKLAQCPAPGELGAAAAAGGAQQEASANNLAVPGEGQLVATPAPLPSRPAASGQPEILVPNQARRAIQVPLARPLQHFQRDNRRVFKLECLVELEGAKARLPARLLDNQLVGCQESAFSYQAETATQRAALSVILGETQVIETAAGELAVFNLIWATRAQSQVPQTNAAKWNFDPNCLAKLPTNQTQ